MKTTAHDLSNIQIAVIGASGLAGRAIYDLLKKNSGRVIGTSFSQSNPEYESLDITDVEAVRVFVSRTKPDIVVYAAGEADPDRAAKNPSRANTLNALSLEFLASCFQGRLVYLSSNYVFDGKNSPYEPSATASPMNDYGKSKVQGEEFAKNKFRDSIIIRNDMIYGEHGPRSPLPFVTKVIQHLDQNLPIILDDTQMRCPVASTDLAQLILELICQGASGVFHLTNGEQVTKYSFAQIIAEEYSRLFITADSVSSLVKSLEISETDRASRPQYTKLTGLVGKTNLRDGISKLILNTSERSKFPVVNPDSGQIVSYKRRQDIHRDGDWHHASRAYIIRISSENEVQILIQERSDVVDLAPNLFDKSIAVQMLQADKDHESTLRRGLIEELGIQSSDFDLSLIGKTGWAQLSKRYEYPELWNREIDTFYIVRLKNSDAFVAPPSRKVTQIRWINFHEFLQCIAEAPETFTKTARFYAITPFVREHISQAVSVFARGGSPSPFDSSHHFDSYSVGDYDVCVFRKCNASKTNLSLYNIVTHEMKMHTDLDSVQVSEDRLTGSLSLCVSRSNEQETNLTILNESSKNRLLDC